MLDGIGNIVKPDFINMYYKRPGKQNELCALNTGNVAADLVAGKMGYCVGLPNGLRFITGFNMSSMSGGPADKNSIDQWFMGFSCISPDGAFLATGKTLSEITCAAGNALEVGVVTPQCWDGKNLDVPDHRSHLSYGAGREGLSGLFCPTTHPYVIPQLSLKVMFTVDSNFKTWQFTSDRQMRQTPGSTLHIDYFEAWSPQIKKIWEENCIDKQLSCSNGDLGNGTQIKGMDYPSGGFSKHQLAPAQGVS
jgi:hypothetical protein